MSADPTKYNALFSGIGEQAARLEVKFQSGDFTSRDLAELGELWSQHIDGLDDLCNEGIRADPEEPVFIKVEGKTIKFRNDDLMGEFIADLLGEVK